MEFEIGQEWQLVNGETVTIVHIDDDMFDPKYGPYTLGSDNIWRDYDGFCVRKDFDEGLNFSHIMTDVTKDLTETSDQLFCLQDDQIMQILGSLKNNGLFDILEFARKVSTTTALKLKELHDLGNKEKATS